MALNDKQLAFANEYLKDKNATQAAIRAGYAEKSAYNQGQRLMNNDEIQSYLAKRTKKAFDKVDISVENTLKGIKEIAEKDDAKDSDRLRAYELLGKYLAMFTEKVDVGQADGKPFEIKIDIVK